MCNIIAVLLFISIICNSTPVASTVPEICDNLIVKDIVGNSLQVNPSGLALSAGNLTLKLQPFLAVLFFPHL